MCDMANQEQLQRQQNHLQIEEEWEDIQQQMQQQENQQLHQQANQQLHQDPRADYRERTADMTEHARVGRTGFKARFSKTRRPLEQMPVQEPAFQTISRTREEATNTNSDLQSNASRETLEARVSQLRDAGMNEIAEAVSHYVHGSRYQVGYTQERKRLMKAIELVNKALGTTGLNEQQRELLEQVKQYFDTMTNGTLVIPEGAKIRDFSNERPREEGNSGRGSSRNAALRTFSTWSDQTDTPLFSHEPVINDLKQRLVSNCYMMASVGGLVECDPALLKSCLKDNGDGTVTVRLFERQTVKKPAEPAQKKAKEQDEFDDFDFVEAEEIEQTELVPVYVRVKKEIPRVMGCVDALSAGALWMQMIEKACAYIGRDGKKGYQSLWYGEGSEFLERLLGISGETDAMLNFYSEQDKNELAESNDLFEQICHSRENRIVFHAGSGRGSADGLNSGHAYTVMGGEVRNGQRLVLLRNPYSMHSLQYKDGGGRQMSDSMLATHSDETYGQFYMKYEDFIHDFGRITHTNLNKIAQ